MTASPRSSNALLSRLPTNPAAPVTSTFIVTASFLQGPVFGKIHARCAVVPSPRGRGGNRENALDEHEAARYWDENADTWTELVRAGFDVYRDYINTPAFLAML